MSAPSKTHTPPDLERRIQGVGRSLHQSLSVVVGSGPGGAAGVGRSLGLDKVFTSRLLKALRQADPVAVLHSIPGPAPLRRFLKAAGKHGVGAADLSRAQAAVDDFERLVREDLGDRSSLSTILSSWLPEARLEFELRRKQSAFKALSELKGISADLNLAAAFLHPSEDAERIDVVWLIGQLGIRRLRPGGSAKFVTRRMVPDGNKRCPTTLDGEPIEGFDRGRLDGFCDLPPAHIEAKAHGDVVHYALAGDSYGPKSAFDLIFAEANLGEMPRYVPSGRRGYVFSEVSVPAKSLVLDVLVHDEVYPGPPELWLYDTALSGVADVNDRARDFDRIDMIETVQSLGRGSSQLRVAEAPRYLDALNYVFSSMSWDESRFHAYRTRVDYPLYGSQVAFVFDPPSRR